MKLLVFDTETTGLPPRKKNTHVSQWWKKYPHIVQISWVMFDTDFNTLLDSYDCIVSLPENIHIPDEASAIHKITNEIMKKKGENIIDILQLFTICIKKCDILIAHNMEFDKKMLIAEYMRNGIVSPFVFNQPKEYCTMKNNIDFCKIPFVSKYTQKNPPYLMNTIQDHTFNKETIDRSNTFVDTITQNTQNYVPDNYVHKKKSPYKYPKLEELHYVLFGTIPKNLHNSLHDVYICLRCYYKQQMNIDIMHTHKKIFDVLKHLV